RGAAVPPRQPRGGLRASARKRPSRRQSRVHRALGLDAPATARARGTPDGAGTLRRGGAGLSRRAGLEEEDPAKRAASRQRLGTARAGGMPAEAKRPDRIAFAA